MSKKQNGLDPTKYGKSVTTIPPAVRVCSPSDAMECLENGSIGAVGRYLRDQAGPVLRSLAKLDPQKQVVGDLPVTDADQPFEFETADVQRAIQNGHWGLGAQYPGELAKVVSLLGDMLDPGGASEYQLKPARRRKGRPQAPSFADRDGDIFRELKFARCRLGGKLEAAISAVGEKRKLSRSSLLRIWGKRNESPTKSKKQRDSVSRARGPRKK
jgi:hypothetical protein